MTKKTERKIHVRYTPSPGCKIVPAGGVFGGLTPHGQLLCNFFVEYQDYPDKSEITVRADGKTDVKSIYSKGNVYVREVQVGVVLSRDVARSVGEWLIHHTSDPTATKSVH